MTAWPLMSIATQKEALGHDTEVRVSIGSAFTAVDQADPFQVRALPRPSTTTQKEALGHDKEVGYPAGVEMLVGADHSAHRLIDEPALELT